MITSLPPWPLFGFDDDARPALRAAAAAGKAAVLATIVALDGGGPRPVGTQMVITDDAVSGFLSGGCLEADVVGHARTVLDDGTPRRLVYGRGSPWPDIRLLCGARIEVQLERVGPHDPATGILLDLGESRAPAVWLSDGARRACARLDHAPEMWPGAFRRLYQPVVRLAVLGADPTALAIAMLGVQIGYETTLIRPRGPVEPPPIAGVAYSRDDPDEALARLGLDPWTAVAVATHDAELDHAALVAALPSKAFYVGALGARRRVPERIDGLRRSGLSDSAIARMRAPIGLDIGGKAPWEVAVAVFAEITAARHAADL
jgi:xanthine dehydrogenase accessory factor